MITGSTEKQRDDLFEVVLNTVSDGVTVIDNDLRIKFQNRAITQVFGPSMIGKHCYKVYRDRDEPCEDCKILEVLKDGRERRLIRDISLPNGDILLVELNSAAIKDAEGNIIGAVEVVRDVTEQKKAEALLNRTLLQQNEALKQLNKDLSDATGYVRTVLPKPLDSGPVRTDWRFIPSASLGGDSFGYHWIDDNHFAMYLIDVSGHGWGAALLSVSVINVLRSHALPDTDFFEPAQVLFALNNTFPGEKNNDMFFSIWYGVYNVSSQKLAYSSGGHPPALLVSGFSAKHIQIDRLRTPSIIIGGQPDVAYQSIEQEIQRPSHLFLFSDGVYEIAGTDGEIWGLNDFITFMAQPDMAGASNLDRLVNHVQTLTQNEAFEDDFTILEIVFE